MDSPRGKPAGDKDKQLKALSTEKSGFLMKGVIIAAIVLLAIGVIVVVVVVASGSSSGDTSGTDIVLSSSSTAVESSSTGLESSTGDNNSTGPYIPPCTDVIITTERAGICLGQKEDETLSIYAMRVQGWPRLTGVFSRVPLVLTFVFGSTDRSCFVNEREASRTIGRMFCVPPPLVSNAYSLLYCPIVSNSAPCAWRTC